MILSIIQICSAAVPIFQIYKLQLANVSFICVNKSSQFYNKPALLSLFMEFIILQKRFQ